MSKSKIKTIAISLGDPSGIGPEVTAKALLHPSVRKLCRFTLIGDQNIFNRYFSRGNFNHCAFVDLENIIPGKFRIGKPNPQSARASLEYLSRALDLIKKRQATALVTAPVCKEAISALGKPFHGHTEYIADYFKVKRFAMMFVTPTLKTVIATRHIPLVRVAKEITPAHFYETLMLTIEALRNIFKISHPRIGVCGINPHAGEEGTIGKEEIKVILPAIKRIRQKNMTVAGPLSADTLFYPAHSKKFDCIIAMYHDQGLIPIKTLYFNKLVNLTIGLPFIRTSPAHGTAFDIAGKNKADPASMIEAIKLAATLTA